MGRGLPAIKPQYSGVAAVGRTAIANGAAMRKVVALVGLWLAATPVSRAVDAPVIFWASSPVLPNETLALAGHSLSAPEPPDTVVELAVVPDGPAGRPAVGLNGATAVDPGGLAWQPVAAVQADGESVKCIVPVDWPRGIWACRIRRGEQISEPILVNAPDPWWFQSNDGLDASPGSEIRVFGRCLTVPAEVPAGVAATPSGLLRQEDGSLIPLTSVTANLYTFRATVPPTARPGHHDLFVHNGHGGQAGWVPAGRVLVKVPEARKAEQFDAADFARPGGRVDEQAIRAAIAMAAENGGGIVFLPRGRYAITGQLELPRGVVLRGAGMELVSLAWPDFEEPPSALISGTQFGLDNVSLYAQNHRTVVRAAPQSEGVDIRNVRIRANCYFMTELPGVPFRGRTGPDSNRDAGSAIEINGSNFSIAGCDILASNFGLFLRDCRGGRVAGNTIRYGGRGYRIESSRQIIFEDNTVEGADLAAIGNDIATFWGNAATHIYFAHNQLRRMFGADREMMTLDAGGGAYRGGVTAAKGTRLELAADPTFKDYAPRPHPNWAGAAAMIIAGKGVGQYRIVTAHAGRSWEIDRPWTVAPDGTSVLSIVPYRGRNLFVGNACEDGGPFQLYGSAHESIVAENTGRRMSGFLVWGLDPHGWGRQPSWYCQFLDNVIAEGNSWGLTTGGFGTVAAGAPADGQGRTVRDVIFRRNQCLSNAGLTVTGNLAGAVVEHNLFRDADTGIVVGHPATGIVVRGNRFERIVKPLLGNGLGDATVR